MATGPYSPDEDATLRRLIPEGVSQSEIGRQLGRTRGSVANRAAKLGIRSDRTQTVAATQAKVIDSRARRAALELLLLEDAERLREQVWKPTTYFDWGGKDHDFDTHDVDEPTPTDKLKLMQAAGIGIDRSLKISVHDSASGHEEAASMAGDILTAVKAAADKLREKQADQ